MDWNKASGLSGIGTFVLTVVLVILTISPNAAGPMLDWAKVGVLVAAMVLAGWLHLKAAQSSRSAPHSLPHPPPQSSPQSPAPIQQAPRRSLVATEPPTKDTVVRVPGDDRVFIDKSALQLEEPFRSFTNYKARQLVADFIKKWVQWTVDISNVSDHGDGPYVLTSITGPDLTIVIVGMTFSVSEAGKVMHLEKGTRIRIEGMIDKIEAYSVMLVDCTLVEIISVPR